ncbi:aldo/keto reductase [Streptomyces swartbergensis]|uniref:Aldo/keto reductase n=1 Tax=Streptomyces swartbergensis TaxID=487165 RepID=A0A243SA82_9ACTN|nr:aldo/keto reductase [Streptomyces swartbergensis]OUD04634.1 aldo/keto reductase [Streptomyces swartbergensis]
MKYRNFGRTGWKVSEIAFGGWQLGGQWGKVDDEASIATLLHAFERGVNFVDTAELYGDGHSEEVIGEALRRWNGDKVYVATKVQPIRWPDPAEDDPQMAGRYPEWYLRQSVEQALGRLGVERLDLFQLHAWIRDGITSLDWLEVLNALRQEGKIDKIGVSIRDYRPEDGVDLARFGLVDSLQVVFNIFEQRPRQALFPAGAESGSAFIARVPFDSGSLIGHWTEDTYATWPEDSVPAWLFRGERFGQTLRRVQELKALCAPYFPTLAEAALRYTLAGPEVSTVIPGMLTPAEVDMNVAYSDGAPFPEELLEALAAHGWPRNFYQ